MYKLPRCFRPSLGVGEVGFKAIVDAKRRMMHDAQQTTNID